MSMEKTVALVFTRFEISSVLNAHKLAALVSPLASEGHLELQIRRGALRGW
jgi:hypothetical protein